VLILTGPVPASGGGGELRHLSISSLHACRHLHGSGDRLHFETHTAYALPQSLLTICMRLSPFTIQIPVYSRRIYEFLVSTIRRQCAQAACGLSWTVECAIGAPGPAPERPSLLSRTCAAIPRRGDHSQSPHVDHPTTRAPHVASTGQSSPTPTDGQGPVTSYQRLACKHRASKGPGT
jgi:hypothetical protein